jgi:hypothetical protein
MEPKDKNGQGWKMNWILICAGIIFLPIFLPVGLVMIFLGVYSDIKETLSNKEKAYKIDEYSGEIVEKGI